jgi:hypothetical protein
MPFGRHSHPSWVRFAKYEKKIVTAHTKTPLMRNLGMAVS